MTQELRQSTQVKVVIGPVVSVSDGFTPVTTLSLASADEAEIMKHDASSVTDISGATFAAITGMDGYYNLTITTSLSDTRGLLTVGINDDSLCLPVTKTFMVLDAFEWDRKYTANSAGLSGVLTYGTAQAGAAGTITLPTTASATADIYNGATIGIASGTGAGQARSAYDYSTGRVADISPNWTTTPSTDSVAVVYATAPGVTVSGALPEVKVKEIGVVGTATISDGLEIARSTTNTTALVLTGNGTGHGMLATSGAGATGNGITATSAATNGNGMSLVGNGTGDGLLATGGAGAGGDGIAGAAGGGVDIRGGITGNVTGNLSGSVGSVTGNVGGNVAGSVGSVTGDVGGNVVGSVDSVVDPVTVDDSTPIDANIKQINGTAVTGDGDGTPWGPA